MGLFLFGNFGTKMARNTKVQKIGDAKLNECEQAIGYALIELESNSDLKAQLRELFIRSAQEIEIGKGKKAIVVFVPVPQLKAFQKIQVRLVRELEKKFSGKHVVFIAQRKILAKHQEGQQAEAEEAPIQDPGGCPQLSPRRHGLPSGDCWQAHAYPS